MWQEAGGGEGQYHSGRLCNALRCSREAGRSYRGKGLLKRVAQGRHKGAPERDGGKKGKGWLGLNQMGGASWPEGFGGAGSRQRPHPYSTCACAPIYWGRAVVQQRLRRYTRCRLPPPCREGGEWLGA